MSRRNALVLLASVLGAVILEVSVLPVFVIDSFKPDLLLIILVFLGLRGSFGVCAPLAWILGLIKDSFGGLYLGLNAFSFLFIFIVIKSISDRVYADSPGLFVLAVSVAGLTCTVLDLLLLLMFTSSAGVIYSIAADLLPHLLVNGFAASLVTITPWFVRNQEVK